LPAPTIIWNRDSILELLRREFARTNRQGGSFVVMLAAVDHPGSPGAPDSNDSQAPLVEEIGKRFSTRTRAYDYIGRYAAEQLLVIAPSCDAPTGALLASKLREVVSQPSLRIPESDQPVTISIALAASVDMPSRDEDDLLRELEKVLYRAQASGGNRVATVRTIASAVPNLRRKRRISLPLAVGAGLLMGIAALFFLAPSWLCAPILLSDIVDSGELPPPLPANCQATNDQPSNATLQALEGQRETLKLVLQSTVTCEIASPAKAVAAREKNRAWVNNFYGGGMLQHHRHVLLAAAEQVPGGTLITVEQCLVPWWRYIDQSSNECWDRAAFWR
jgi:diguanylate cyclase (GGDEF)-like protein